LTICLTDDQSVQNVVQQSVLHTLLFLTNRKMHRLTLTFLLLFLLRLQLLTPQFQYAIVLAFLPSFYGVHQFSNGRYNMLGLSFRVSHFLIHESHWEYSFEHPIVIVESRRSSYISYSLFRVTLKPFHVLEDSSHFQLILRMLQTVVKMIPTLSLTDLPRDRMLVDVPVLSFVQL